MPRRKKTKSLDDLVKEAEKKAKALVKNGELRKTDMQSYVRGYVKALPPQ
jgi:hypothetical protein